MRVFKKSIPVRPDLFKYPLLIGEKPRLMGSKCTACGQVSFPRKRICPKCHQEQTVETVTLSRTGKLYTFAVVRVAPPGFNAPYALGYVDLPEGVRVFSQLTECEFEKLKIGMEMEVTIEKLTEDQERNDIIGYKFKPVE